ncbi:MAG: hypothetical protein AAF363_06860 [Bacteroidota bacterium]
MKLKLKKFTEFANNILPHEVSILQSASQFEKDDNKQILDRIAHNAHNSTNQMPYDTSIDKRKYSNMMIWITKRLQEKDVDFNFEWINEKDKKVLSDSINPKEESDLLKAVDSYKAHSYYFIKFYELMENFRHFLLIRLRIQEHKVVDEFIEKYKKDYERCKKVSIKLHTATQDIIEQYSTNNTESRQWEEWLLDVFYDETLDGRNRYFAVVRITFMYLNYREFDKLKVVYDDLDKMFHQGTFYSKRILINYYANSVLLHSKFDILQQAEEYGYLSIKQKNVDYLQYLNNYCAILLRQGKVDQALSLMRESFSEMRSSNNFHNKIGFVAFYVNCLVDVGQFKEAAQFSESFLMGYRNEVLSQRWHIFFAAYLKALVKQEKYDTIVKLNSRFQLLKRDKAYQQRPIYTPVVNWYIQLSYYMENFIDEDELYACIRKTLDESSSGDHKSRLIKRILNELSPIVPEVFSRIKSTIKK